MSDTTLENRTTEYRFETLALHGGHTPDSDTKSRAVPIYQTTSYVFDSAEHGAQLFNLEVPGNIYTRIMNPTQAVLETRLAQLEGGIGALAVASGQAAIALTFQTLLKTGDHIVAGNNLYGGTYNLLHNTLPRNGITTTFVDSRDVEAFRAAIQPNTKAIYIEAVGNPKLDIPEFEVLQKHPKVAWVNYPGLEDHESHGAAKRYFRPGAGFGGILTFGVKGGLDAGKTVINKVQLFSRLANIGDAKSLIIHPASTTHAQLSPEERATTGVTEDLIRLSVGLEHIQDLIEDLDFALTEVRP